MKIEMNGKYQTRDGRAVRILAVDYPADMSVIALVKHTDGTREILVTYTAEGKYVPGSKPPLGIDLVPVPEPWEVWVALYKSKNGTYPSIWSITFDSLEVAKQYYTGAEGIGFYHITDQGATRVEV